MGTRGIGTLARRGCADMVSDRGTEESTRQVWVGEKTAQTQVLGKKWEDGREKDLDWDVSKTYFHTFQVQVFDSRPRRGGRSFDPTTTPFRTDPQSLLAARLSFFGATPGRSRATATWWSVLIQPRCACSPSGPSGGFGPVCAASEWLSFPTSWRGRRSGDDPRN